VSVSIKSIEPISCLSDVLLAPGNAGMFSKASVGCLTRDGRFFSGSFGIENDSHHEVFDIASITKVIVTLLYHRLSFLYPEKLNDGILVKDIIPISGDFTETLSVRHLLEFLAVFKSGHPTCEYVKDNGYTFDELINSICTGGLTCPPGTEWKYSNVHTMLLGRLLEIIFEKTLGKLIHDETLCPLDIKRTIYGPNEYNSDEINDPAASSIWKNERKVTGAAGYFSSVHDLCRMFYPLIMEGKASVLDVFKFGHGTKEVQFIVAETARAIHSGLTEKFGYGFGKWSLFRENIVPVLIEDPLGFHKLGHTGCIVAGFPSHSFIMVVLTDYEKSRLNAGSSGHTRRELYSLFGQVANTFCGFSKKG
jgi:CubicO group peptidase (beta-lactamase class C family)